MIWIDTDYRPKSVSLGDVLGFLPHFLDEDDPRPAKEQLDANYRHGGGWQPIPGFRFNPESRSLRYPGDPVLKPWVETKLRDETILVYPHSLVLIIQPDGTFSAARVD